MRLDRTTAQVLVIDVQERLLPQIHEQASVVERCVRLLRGAAVLELPITLSEQYPEGLGTTAGPIREAVGRPPDVVKSTFSVCGDEGGLSRLKAVGRPQVLLVGIETHVCVQQTALDLLVAGLLPVVLADAVGSRRPFDRDIALERMRAAGAIVTTVEAALFEMSVRCDTPAFKQILKIVK